MKMPKRGEKGFTLVELLIVLAILAVLAAVVIPNVTGMFGRGASQAYETDQETMQMACATFYFDSHLGPDPDGTWAGGDTEKLHNYPTPSGEAPSDIVVDVAPITPASGTYQGQTLFEVQLVTAGAGALITTTPGIDPAAVWVGLLVNTPGLPTADNTPGECAPQALEKGPYLNEFPKSSSAAKNGNPTTPGGTYTWIVAANGKVHGVSFIDLDGAGTGVAGWYAGFNGTYP